MLKIVVIGAQVATLYFCYIGVKSPQLPESRHLFRKLNLPHPSFPLLQRIYETASSTIASIGLFPDVGISRIR